jgi:hypothetical protein
VVEGRGRDILSAAARCSREVILKVNRRLARLGFDRELQEMLATASCGVS